MLPRTLEAEVMDTEEEAREYDAMDHSQVNQKFAADFLAAHGPCLGGQILDVGAGTAQIPIELCRQDKNARVVAIDLSPPMIDLAIHNIQRAGLETRIVAKLVDAKRLQYDPDRYEAVVSNSIIHHIPEPAEVLAAMARLVQPGGTLFVRDLCRPDTLEQLTSLVAAYAGNETSRARQLFDDSLHAALRVDEIATILTQIGLSDAEVERTSDRHWTLAWRAPANPGGFSTA